MTKRRPLTPEEKMEASQLRAIYEDRKAAAKATGGHITQAVVAEMCGWSNQSAFGHYVTGRLPLNLESLLLIAKALNFDPSEVSPRLTANIPASDAASNSQGGNAPAESDYALIPQYSAKGECGDGYLNDHVEVNGGLAFKREWLKRVGAKPENLYVFYADSDSMEPYIFSGDVVLFDTSCIEPQDRQVYAIRRPDGGISIKRLVQQLSGAWLVRSDNPDKAQYPDEAASEAVLHDIPILGRVIWRGGGIG